MPPKRKDFLKSNSQHSKHKPREPETENDFLEAADEFEQAGGKWRAGDAAKATRFFKRAVDTYNAGLQRYQGSFDLAYNKANLEYQMAQDARIASQLGSTIDLLQETLESHRFALSLDQENADILFNTAQVLTSLAEALTEHVKSDDPAQESKTAARALLEEAFRKFSECLARQEAEYAEMQQQIEATKAQEEQAGLAADDPATSEAHDAPSAPSAEAMETSSTSSEPPEEWATVVEPITPAALLDTVIAQLSSLTTLVSLSAPADANTISQLSNLALPLINTKIPHYTSLLPPPSSAPDTSPAPPPSLSLSATSPEDAPTTPKDDAILSSAAFRAALLDTSFRSNLLSAPLYSAHLAETFTPLLPAPNAPLSAGGATNAITAYAEALIDFAATVGAKEPLATTTTSTPPSTSPSTAAPTTPSPTRKDQWTALSKADRKSVV